LPDRGRLPLVDRRQGRRLLPVGKLWINLTAGVEKDHKQRMVKTQQVQ
jgi:hypothetical protein